MTEPVNNKVEVITRFEKGKPNTYSFDGGKTFIDKLPVNNEWIDDIFNKLDKSIVNGITLSIVRDEVFDTDPILEKAKLAILSKLESIEQEAYKRGYVDGGIEILNASCEVCHAYPMTADCNNANCHAIER